MSTPIEACIRKAEANDEQRAAALAFAKFPSDENFSKLMVARLVYLAARDAYHEFDRPRAVA